MAVAAQRREKQAAYDDEKRMELTEHLAELRSRIIRCILYITVGACICYHFFKPIYRVLFLPMLHAMEGQSEWKIVFTHFPQAFFVVLQVSVVAGMIVVAPLVTMETWAFLAPALTREEKKPLKYIAPMSVTLFIGGVALAYWVSGYAIKWLVSYVSWFPNGVLYQDPKAYVMFILKMMGVFGLVFQLPIVLMFLAWVGILRSGSMKRSWRTAVVGISVITLFVMPTNDAFTMLMMLGPVTGLYLGSIWLVQIIERKRERKLREV